MREITFEDMETKTFEEVFPDKEVQSHCFGFYDWFCRNTSLKNKGKKLWGKAKSISRSTKFDPKKVYIFFKNNCPCVGPLYDDFRICDKESTDVLYTVTPSCTVDGKSVAEVWGHDNDFSAPLVRGTWREVRAWFLG